MAPLKTQNSSFAACGGVRNSTMGPNRSTRTSAEGLMTVLMSISACSREPGRRFSAPARVRSCCVVEGPRYRSVSGPAESRYVRNAPAPKRLSGALDRNGEYVSDATFGLNEARRARVAFQLAPQAHVDAAVEHVLVHARRLQEVLPSEGALRRLEKRDEQREFAFGQRRHSAFRIGEPPRPLIELPAGKPEAAAVALARRRRTSAVEPSEHGAHPRQQFAQVEGFRQVVVSAKLQSDDPIDIVAAMTGNDDDRNVGIRADVAEQIEAILLTEHEIEDHQIHFVVAELTRHVLVAFRDQCADVILLKVVDDHASQGGVVLDDEDTRPALAARA